MYLLNQLIWQPVKTKEHYTMKCLYSKVTGKPVEMTMRTMCAWAGLHTSDRLLLEAVREVNLFDHAGIRTGDPRSDRRQVQDFTTELRVLE